jgi:hypothetical protein
MKSKVFSAVILGALTVVSLSACSAVARHHKAFAHDFLAPNSASDPLSGQWNVSFFVHDKATPATFTFKLDGEKVRGTAYSDHTGAGTIRDGKWVDGKLSFVLDFKKHESIFLKGGFEKDKLAGEFTTEGFTARWEAVKKTD